MSETTSTDYVPAAGLTQQQIRLLLSPLHPSRVRQLDGHSHLEAWDVRRWLTRIFGFTGWSDEILSCELVHEQMWPVLDQKTKAPVLGKNRCTAVYRVTLRLTVKDPRGNVLGFWDDAATGDAVNQPTVGDAHDLALKTAVSQALKRCAANLGDQFGLSLYNNGSASPVVLRLATSGTESDAPVDDAPVVGGELDEPREGEPQAQVAEAVERKAKRERRSKPPVEDEFAPAPQDAPSDGQLRNLAIALKERGFTTDDARYAEMSRIVGRPITSAKQLSVGEARHVLRSLAGTPQNPAPNPRNGDGPVPAVTAAALATPTLEKLVARAQGEDAVPVAEQLQGLIESAPTPEHINRVGQLAVEARDGRHLTPEQFDGLASVVTARREALGLVGDEAPTAQQYEARDALEQRVRRAWKQDDFTAVWGALVDSEAAGQVTKVQFNALKRMLDARYESVKARWSQPQAAGEQQAGEGWSHQRLAEMAGAGGGR